MTTTAELQSARRNQQFKDELHRLVVDVADLSRIDGWSRERLRAEVLNVARTYARHQDRSLSAAEIDRTVEEVVDEVFGLGPLEPFLRDPNITEILVNAPDQVYVEIDGLLRRTDACFTDHAHLVRVIQRIASRVGRRVDESSPMVDARLPDGSRVNAILPPLTLDSAVLSIRRFGLGLTPDDYLSRLTCTSEMLSFLQTAVRCRANILICGGSGAGKTTLLNVLSGFIPAMERLVTIEDAAELNLYHPHVVRMETRSANMEGVGQVTQRELLRNALRMRPDRIILGECRGPETVDMLQAMNTGHEGSLTTVHANDTKDSLSRLELMVGLANVDIPVPILRTYIASAFHLVIHINRLAGGSRRIVKVSELIGLGKNKNYRLRDIFAFEQTGVDRGHAIGNFRATGYRPRLLARFATAGQPLDEQLFEPRVLAEVKAPSGPGTSEEPLIMLEQNPEGDR